MTDSNKLRSAEFEEMKNKDSKLPSSSSVSELILSAVYFLQKKNGVSAKDITKYICHKRGFKQSQMKNKVKEALDRGIRNGIFNFKRGLYKVDENCKRKLTNLKKKIKKKSDVNKFQKKLAQKKVSVDKTVIEEKKLTPINEDPDKSSVFKPRVRSHTLSEDVFDRRGRENSYFEPSVLARPSDEEYDDYDDEDNEDDEYSDMDEIDHRDIFMVTFADEASHDRFPDLNIYNAARQTKQKRVSTRRKGRNKSANRRKAKKRKISKPRKKKLPEEEEKKKKPKELESDDDDYLDEEESEYSEESDSERRKEKTKLGLLPETKKNKEKKKAKLEESKKHKEHKENKEHKEHKENKEGKDCKDSKGSTKKKTKQTTVLMTKKFKKSKCESSDENMLDENEENLLEKSEQSLSKSECMITSSTKLLPSDFKLSISPNMIVSDVKFSPTNIKFETQDSSTVLLADTVKNEPTDQEELFNDFNIFCECQPPKRKNSADLDDQSSSMEAEPIQKRIKSKWSQK